VSDTFLRKDDARRWSLEPNVKSIAVSRLLPRARRAPDDIQ
jgi:hypothetical protein